MKANQGGLAQLIATSENILMASAAATLRLDQRIVQADTSGGAFAITLPPVNEAIGMMFSFRVAVAGNALTVQDQNESEGWADITLDAVNDRVVVYSDGVSWHTLASAIA